LAWGKVENPLGGQRRLARKGGGKEAARTALEEVARRERELLVKEVACSLERNDELSFMLRP